MAINVGWRDAKFSSRGQYYSRYANRHAPPTASNLQWVEKHSGYVYSNVVKVNGKWEGRGFIGIEPKYANLSGGDEKLRSSPHITRSQLMAAQKSGKSISFNTIKLRKPTIISFKKPIPIGRR